MSRTYRQQVMILLGGGHGRCGLTRMPLKSVVVPGVPFARVLVEAGSKLWAIGASPVLPGKYAVRFPANPVICKQAERSGLSGR